MKKILLTTLFTILSFLLLPTFALAELKIAVVDLQKALASSEAGKKAQAKYKKEVLSEQSSISAKKKDLDEKKANLKKLKDSLNKKAVQKKSAEIAKIEKDLQKSYRESQQNLRKKNATVVTDLITKMKKVIDKIGEEEKLSLILEKGSQTLLFSAGVEDITDKVVSKFNSGK